MKQAWDRTKLSVLFWEGQPAQAGDGLETTTGRRYLIIAVRGRILECLVLPKGEPAPGTIFQWRWAKRARRIR